jgi:hypothetical protein
MQEDSEFFSRRVVLSRDRVLEQFGLDALGQIAPERCDGLSERQLEGGDIARVRSLIAAFASPVDDLDRLDDFAGVGLCSLRGSGNQELGRHAGTEVPQRLTKRLLELELSLGGHDPSSPEGSTY